MLGFVSRSKLHGTHSFLFCGVCFTLVPSTLHGPGDSVHGASQSRKTSPVLRIGIALISAWTEHQRGCWFAAHARHFCVKTSKLSSVAFKSCLGPSNFRQHFVRVIFFRCTMHAGFNSFGPSASFVPILGITCCRSRHPDLWNPALLAGTACYSTSSW